MHINISINSFGHTVDLAFPVRPRQERGC